MKPDFTPRSILDMAAIARRIARDNPVRARDFAGELKQKCIQVAQSPKLYRIRDNIAVGLRIASYGDYLIFFREIPHGVRIERVLHGARNYAELF